MISSIRPYRSRLDALSERATDEVVAGAIGALSVVAFGALFLALPTYSVFPVVTFALAAAYGWYRNQGATAKSLTFLATASTVIILGLIVVYLLWKSLLVFRIMGLDLFRLASPFWETSKRTFALTPMIWGTVVTTLIATCVAGPLGIAGAIFIAEMAPPRARGVVKPAVEMLAGIPSIVYGFIGFNVVNPAMSDYLGLVSLGSLFAVGLVIGVMALPTVVSVAEDAVTAVPDEMTDGALALGTTDWQSIKSVVIPASFSGLSAAVLLGIGRAVGETMAATVMLGHNQALPDPLYDVFANTETLTTLIASQYGNAITRDDFMSALFAAGVVLFVTVLCLSLLSRYIEARMQSTLGGST
ncbi:phosphate transport system permease protein PstC [Halarchaeum acidiphilum MH1-52-1]|uniref:Phosphate transport system permease protein n=1 Tax=Halarchaeum acidiphilum MH1-52-1 TaxID=1261545 RepID=U2YEV4_9EURY|nr:phosphate ABC transporter permease subunit PstC [Halarchaeum acidiphilum]GAD52401.1 phosphate transport system permease protein PstC [Halarchaeum acidiphilum MH1-52-1]